MDIENIVFNIQKNEVYCKKFLFKNNYIKDFLITKYSKHDG